MAKKDKLILLHGFSSKEINLIIDNYLKQKLPKTAFATSTQTNLKKKLKDVIKEIIEDYKFNR